MVTRLGSYFQIKGSSFKQPCIVATLSDINLTGATNIVDGVLLNIDDRVLATNQIQSQYNGIYSISSVGTGSDGVWERAIDFSIEDDIFQGINIYVYSGNTYSDSYFILDSPNPIILDSTPLIFTNKKLLSIDKVGENQVLFYSENNITGSTNFTYDKTKEYLKLGDTNTGLTRLHIYGENIGSYTNEVDVSPNSAIFLDGTHISDKSVVFGDDGVKKWALQTYRKENGDYYYVTNLEANILNQVYSRSGRSGINKQSNVMNYHAQYMDLANGLIDDMDVGGWYDRLYQSLYNVAISVQGGLLDEFHWKKSRDGGATWSNWSVNIPCSTGETELEYFITVKFSNLTGHSLFDIWEFTAFPQLPQGTFTINPNGYTEILTTENFTQLIPTIKNVTNGLSTTFNGFETCLSTTISAIYVGWKLPFNSIYFNNGENANGITLKFEYYSPSGWTQIETGETLGTLRDFTDNLIKDGKVEWDRQELNWISYQFPGEGDGYNLYWIRITTTSTPTRSLVIDSLSLGGLVRLGVYSASMDKSPSFYVDGTGRVIMGDYNHIRDNGAFTNLGYLGVNTSEPQDMVHLYGIDNIADETDTQHNHIMIDGRLDGDKGIMFADDGVKKFEEYLYRNEKGEFKYTYSYSADRDIMVMSEGGRFGINWTSNEMNTHAMYFNNMGDGNDSLVVGGLYSKRIVRLYEIKIINILPTPNEFEWRESIDYGNTWSIYYTGFTCSYSPQLLEYGIEISFIDIAGHSLNDYWRFWAFPQLPDSTFTIAPDMFSQVRITPDSNISIPIYNDKTYNSSFTEGLKFELLNSGISSYAYIGQYRRFNSIFISINTLGSGITLKVEYSTLTGWTELEFDSHSYIDQTNNLKNSGLISWDITELTDWDQIAITGISVDLYNWIRISSKTDIIVSPIVNLVAPHGSKRFSVKSSQLDSSPSFFIDSLGDMFATQRSVVGSNNITENSKFQVYNNNNKLLDVQTGGTIYFNQYTTDGYLKTRNSTGEIYIEMGSGSGSSGTSGTGPSGETGSSGTSGSGSPGSSGTSGTGPSGETGTSGSSGLTGTSGTSGLTGTSGTAGTSGTSGSTGTSGTSGTTGTSGSSGTSGLTGSSGSSGISGTLGTSGTTGTSGTSGSSGTSGLTGSSGRDGFSTTGSTIGDTMIWDGNNWISQPGIIGHPYNTYSDGLFTDWTSTTPIGTTIDLINEVLKGLAPPPAPTLTLSSTVVGGTVQASSGKISFGIDNMISGYWYSGFTVGTSYYLSAGNGSITGTLASNTSAHTYSYPLNSFNNSGIITISNIYSGTTYSHSVNLGLLTTGSTYVSTVSGITMTISAASYCKFSDGITPFTQFTYRTGTWSVASTNLNNGFNMVQVLYQSSSIGSNTFMVDKDSTATTVTVPVLTGLTMTGSKYLSGVRYHTSGTALYSATINNAYKNTYYDAGTISFTITNGTMASTTIPNVTGNGSDVATIPITNRTLTINATRLLNQSIDAKVNVVTRTLSKSSTPTGNAVQTISGILMDSVTDSSTNTLDYFDGEGYRLKDIVYTTWPDITGSTNAWDSIDSLTGFTGLQVYGGNLVYPSINFSTITYVYSGNPNYVGLTGAKTYVRKFYVGLGVSNMILVMSGSGTGTIKASSDSTGNYIWVEAKSGLAPGPTLTGWKDCYTTVAGGGCYGSTYGASRTFGGSWGLTFGTDGSAYSNGYVIIKITTNAAITSSQIQLTAF